MPNVSVTSVLLALNVAIFGLMLAWGIDPMQPAIDSLIQWGANYGPKTTQVTSGVRLPACSCISVCCICCSTW